MEAFETEKDRSTTVVDLQRSISELSKADYAVFRSWFWEREWEEWDRELEEDVATGKLDALADEALAAKERGELTPL